MGCKNCHDGPAPHHWQEAVAGQCHGVALHRGRHKVEDLGVHVERREGAGRDDDALEAVKHRLDGQRRVQAPAPCIDTMHNAAQAGQLMYQGDLYEWPPSEVHLHEVEHRVGDGGRAIIERFENQDEA